MKSTKKSLLLSTLSLLLCFAMLLGTTYAWFTDEVTSGRNTIKAGNLDVELYHGKSATVDATDANKVTSETPLFNVGKWEPGMIVYENFLVKNVGNLALKYALNLNIYDKNSLTTDSVAHDLSEVIKVAVSEVPFSGDRADAEALPFQTLADFQKTGSLVPAAGDTYGVVLYWEPTDSDNLYNVNNGQSVNTSAAGVNKETAGNALFIDFGVKLTATQLTYEYDSFDNMYDNIDSTNVPAFWSGESEKAKITSDAVNEYQVVKNEQIKASVTIPENATVTYADGSEIGEDDEFALVVEPGTNNSNGVTIGTGNSITTFDVSLENVVTHEKVKAIEAMKVTLDVGFIDLIRFYHKGTEYTNEVSSADAVAEVGQFYYDPATGIVTFMTKDFSPFSAVYKFAGGVGTEAHPYLIATTDNFDAIHTMAKANTENANFLQNVNFKLVADLDYTGKTFPSATQDRIVWKNVKFDGADHKIVGANATPANSTGGPECLLGNYFYGSNEIKNLTIENSTFNGFFYSGDDNLQITNVTIKNSIAYDGAFVNWGSTSRVEICNSKLVDSSVKYRGWAGSVGGFIGNTQNALIENSAIIRSTIESGSSAVGGFICQGGANDVVVTNCTVDADSVVRNTNAAQYAYAIAGTLSNTTPSTGNIFYGRVECANKDKVGIAGLDTTAYTKDSVWSSYNSDIVASNFTFNAENGTITYNGTGSYDKFVVEQRIWTSNCTSGVYTGVGGFQKDFDKHEFSTKDLTFTKLTKLQQYAPNATVAAMFKSTTTDSSYVGEQYASNIATGGKIYIKDGVCTATFLDEAGNGQFIGGTGKTDNKTDYTVTVLVKAMVGDTNVGSTSFTYVVPLATN